MIYALLGMHKSGTSLLSRILHESSINMGDFDESKGYDEVNFPGSNFHVILPLSNSSKKGETNLGEEVKVQVG